MASMFKPKTQPMPKMPKIPPPPLPKPVRMPFESDPALEAAAERAKQSIKRRKGRQSTIMTDRTLSGSTGTKLGA